MISVIFMDIGNVLVDFDIRRLLAAVVEKSGKDQHQALLYLLKSGLAERYEKGLVTSQQLFESVRAELAFPGTFEEFRDSWNGIFQENAGGVQAFHALKKSKPVILASNTNEMHFAYLEQRYPFFKLADGAVLSHKVHARKPEPDFFRKALARAAVPPEETLLIDDSPENIDGARKLGMLAVQFTGFPALKESLVPHGLAV